MKHVLILMNFIQIYFTNQIQTRQMLNHRDNYLSLSPGMVTMLCVYVGGEGEPTLWIFSIADNDFWQEKQFIKL